MYSAGKVVFRDLTTHLLALVLRPRRTQKTCGRASHVSKNIHVHHPGVNLAIGSGFIRLTYTKPTPE